MINWRGKFISALFWLVGFSVADGITSGRFPFLRRGEDFRSQKFLSQIADKLNRTAPRMIDADTQLLNAQGLEGVFVYNYRLVNWTKSEIPPDFADLMRKPITTAACSRPEMVNGFLKKDVVLRYNYEDKNSAPVATLDIKLADCK